jgi:hypothetical protein
MDDNQDHESEGESMNSRPKAPGERDRAREASCYVPPSESLCVTALRTQVNEWTGSN